MNKRGTMIDPEEDRRYIPFTPEQLQAMGDMYREGWSTYRLAKRYGISPTTVTKRLVAMGVEIRSIGNRKVTAEVAGTARRMRRDGRPWRDVEKVTGVHQRSIMRVLRAGLV